MSRFYRIRRVAVTGSTNEDMARILGEASAAGLTIVADYQEHGAGRKGRSWIAPPGSALLFTTALPDPMPSADLWLVPFWIALVVHDALREHGIATALQWPNDVLIGARKAGGILCISRVSGEYAWAACGVGLNVRRPSDDDAFRDVVPPPAFASDVAEIDREALLQTILRCAEKRYDDLTAPQRVMREWEQAANLPGARYRIALDDGGAPFAATALRLLPGGSLLVDQDGMQREVSLAEARVLRD